MTDMLIVAVAALLMMGFAVWPMRDFPWASRLSLVMVCRAPLISVLMLVALPLWVWRSGTPLLRNLFVMESGVHVVWVTLFSAMAAWVSLACIDTFLEHAGERLVDLPERMRNQGPERRDFIRRFVALVIALPMLGVVATYSLDGERAGISPLTYAGCLVLGLAAVALLGVAVERLRDWLARDVMPWAGSTWLGRLAGNLPDFLRDGYLEEGRLARGHLRMGGYFGLFLFVYLAGLVLLHPLIGNPSRWPTLAYALVLIASSCTLFSGLTFFLDRWRIPLLVAVVLIGIATSYLPWFDKSHTFRASARSDTSLPSPTEALRKRLAGRPPDAPIVVVAAAGGGLAAAAWTARVLVGLEQELGPEFARSVVFVSGVSGGSVGLLHSVGAEDLKGKASFHDLWGEKARVVEAASQSVLPAVGWGLLYPDLTRTLLPIVPSHIDRGWALERTWGRSFVTQPTWSEWVQRTAEGSHPAVAFNATALESGARMVFCTVSLEHPPASDGSQVDPPRVDPITAARLSATFPYVTPAARLKVDEANQAGHYHLLDGGYFDNSGIVTALQWIDHCFDKPEADRVTSGTRSIVLLIVDAFPRHDELDPPQVSSGLRPPVTGSWTSATLGPVLGVVNVRTGSQRERIGVALGRMKRLLHRERNMFLLPVRIHAFSEGSLSWQLTRSERLRLDQDWEQWRARLVAANEDPLKLPAGMLEEGQPDEVSRDPWVRRLLKLAALDKQ